MTDAKMEARRAKIADAKAAGVAVTEKELQHAETVIPSLEEEAVEVWNVLQQSVGKSLERIETFLQTRGALLVARTKGRLVVPGVPYTSGDGGQQEEEEAGRGIEASDSRTPLKSDGDEEAALMASLVASKST